MKILKTFLMIMFKKVIKSRIMFLIKPILIRVAAPAAAGGFTWFLHGLLNNRYKDKIINKMFIEIIGAILTAIFIIELIEPIINKKLAAFCIGITWSGLIQLIQAIITRKVKNKLE